LSGLGFCVIFFFFFFYCPWGPSFFIFFVAHIPWNSSTFRNSFHSLTTSSRLLVCPCLSKHLQTSSCRCTTPSSTTHHHHYQHHHHQSNLQVAAASRSCFTEETAVHSLERRKKEITTESILHHPFDQFAISQDDHHLDAANCTKFTRTYYYLLLFQQTRLIPINTHPRSKLEHIQETFESSQIQPPH
jgi:hypothetical protein